MPSRVSSRGWHPATVWPGATPVGSPSPNLQRHGPSSNDWPSLHTTVRTGYCPGRIPDTFQFFVACTLAQEGTNETEAGLLVFLLPRKVTAGVLNSWVPVLLGETIAGSMDLKLPEGGSGTAMSETGSWCPIPTIFQALIRDEVRRLLPWWPGSAGWSWGHS